MDCRVHQTSLSMGFSRREYWSGLPFPPPVDLPNLGIKTESPLDPVLAGRFFTTEATRELYTHTHTHTHPHILFKDMELNELMLDELNVGGKTGRAKIVASDTVALRRLKEGEEPAGAG